MNAMRERLVGHWLTGGGSVRYRLDELLEEGALGWVFRGTTDARLPEGVRVLLFRPNALTLESLSRFERDALTLQALAYSARANPHLVHILDHARVRITVGPSEPPSDLPFAVFEFVSGTSLDALLAAHRGHGLPLDRTHRVAGDLASALSELHGRGIVHHHFTPSNVILHAANGRELTKLAACGLPIVGDFNPAVGGQSSPALGYSAPERFERDPRRVGPRSDIFSFAAILFEMLTGSRAFPHGQVENPLVVVARLLNGPRPSLARFATALAPELGARRDLIERLDSHLACAMAAELADRQKAVSEFWAAIDPLLGQAYEDRSALGTSTTVASERSHPVPRAVPNELLTTARQTPPESFDEKRVPGPAEWTWRLRAEPMRPGLVRAACFDPAGGRVVALSSDGLLHWAETGWTRLPDIPGLDLDALRGIAWLGEGELIAFGARGLVGRLRPGASFDPWTLSRYDLTFHGVHVDRGSGVVTLVGERPTVPGVRGGVRVDTLGTIARNRTGPAYARRGCNGLFVPSGRHAPSRWGSRCVRRLRVRFARRSRRKHVLDVRVRWPPASDRGVARRRSVHGRNGGSRAVTVLEARSAARGRADDARHPYARGRPDGHRLGRIGPGAAAAQRRWQLGAHER